LNKPDFISKNANYEGCRADFEDARIVLVGGGFDGTSSYRPGSRFAPIALRSETILSQEDYSPYFKKDLKDKAVHDLGDVEVPFGNTSESLNRIEAVSRFIVDSGKIPFFIGGEHLITLAALKPIMLKYPDLHIIQLDAHLDLMDELFGDRISHGTVMRRIYELMNGQGKIYQVGIRSGSPEEYQFAEAHTQVFEFNTTKFLRSLDMLRNRPVYLTVDLDVFDPSLIPATGTPEAGGIFFQEFIDFLRALRDLQIVGADMVELSPAIDPSNTSTIVASKILRESLIMI
jgi:agmatinase